MGLQISLDEESFRLLQNRGRSKSFKGQFHIGQQVTAVCGDQEQPAVIARAGRNTWVAKPLEFLNAKAAE